MATITEHLPEVEQQTAFYLKKLTQIDRILRPPVETLINLAPQMDRKPGERSVFPSLLSDRHDFSQDHSPHTQALCFATLQKLWRLRRRFPWLMKNTALEAVKERLIQWFLPEPPSTFPAIVAHLQSEVLGNLNPLTASYVFRVLLEAGESQAHSALGFLAVFAIIWPLYRRYPDRLSSGARIEPWEPSAYVTANCLLPIIKVQRVASHRANILTRVQDHLEKLASLLEKPDERKQWLFNLELDHLCANLRRLSRVTLIRQPLEKLATYLATLSSTLIINPANGQPYHHAYDNTIAGLRNALAELGLNSAKAIEETKPVLEGLEASLVGFLEDRASMEPDALRACPVKKLLANPLDLKFAKEYLFDPEYWKDLRDAAKRSLEFCRALLTPLLAVSKLCSGISMESTVGQIVEALKQLTEANDAVVNTLRKAPVVQSAAQWSRDIMHREIAHASAGNLTDFDPAELVSAIAVAVRWDLITTNLQVSDAVSKALQGARKDGSWRLGLPFFSPDNTLGIWPVTSEIVWTLTAAIQSYPDVTVADEKLFRYVDWLERTRTVLRREDKDLIGWASDRLRHTRKIHLMTTAFSINALLEIRDLVEYRLLQLCQKRFAAVSVLKGLNDLDPVDLGASHINRLHGLLAHMAAETQGTLFPAAQYSLILHGPPGSSKTKVAEALSFEMWRESRRWGRDQSRFIRVTPADFTRMGEDRLDSEARLIFDLLSHVRGVTIFFDEIDDLLRRRNPDPHQPNFLELVVPAMLNRLADLRDACPRQEICFLLATNYIETIEPALIRPGRIDRSLPVVYPDSISRLAILWRHLHALRTDTHKLTKVLSAFFESRLEQITRDTRGWPWMAIEKFCKDLRTVLLNTTGSEQDLVRNLNRVLADNGRGFARPQYESRWQKDGGKCPEFVNEREHYVICRDGHLDENVLSEECGFMDAEGRESFRTGLQERAEQEGRLPVGRESADATPCDLDC